MKDLRDECITKEQALDILTEGRANFNHHLVYFTSRKPSARCVKDIKTYFNNAIIGNQLRVIDVEGKPGFLKNDFIKWGWKHEIEPIMVKHEDPSNASKHSPSTRAYTKIIRHATTLKSHNSSFQMPQIFAHPEIKKIIEDEHLNEGKAKRKVKEHFIKQKIRTPKGGTKSEKDVLMKECLNIDL
ncbi:MAG: hypothetical protein H6618_06775 [Deltaproteobacteria bacterium]|nr:hypothetical protein [Deltaproteobacteria bacterium]